MQKTVFLENRIFPLQQGEPYLGKVRNVYRVGNLIIVVVTDEISAYDRNLPFEVEGKGVMLNQIAAHFLKETEDIVANWLLAVPNPRVSIGYYCEPIRIEMVVRARLEGSMWKDYSGKKRKRKFWDYKPLPDGMKQGELLPELMVTPTTKALTGHDQNITHAQIIKRGLATAEQYDEMHATSLKVFARGQEKSHERGLELVDTKYEYGIRNGKLTLIDEIHTPDSSRYYILEELNAGTIRQLSKEFVRVWLKENGFEGKPKQKMPQFSAGYANEVSGRYKELFANVMAKEISADDIERANNKDVVYNDTIDGLVACFKYMPPILGIIEGSESDEPVMSKAEDFAKMFNIPYEKTVVSAHRTPMRLVEYATTAWGRGIRYFIAGAGGAAHLPGMAASFEPRIITFGVPIKSSNSIDGWDSMLSILQMPTGRPVATVALNASGNATLLVLQCLAARDAYYEQVLLEYNRKNRDMVIKSVHSLIEKGQPNQFDVAEEVKVS